MNSNQKGNEANDITIEHIVEYYNPNDGAVIAEVNGIWEWVEEQ